VKKANSGIKKANSGIKKANSGITVGNSGISLDLKFFSFYTLEDGTNFNRGTKTSKYIR
jgi:hypothetical protein